MKQTKRQKLKTNKSQIKKKTNKPYIEKKYKAKILKKQIKQEYENIKQNNENQASLRMKNQNARNGRKNRYYQTKILDY